MRQILYIVLMWITCIYAIVRGGWAERTVALTILIGSGVTPLLLSPIADRFRHVETAVVFVDIAVFAILFGVGLFSRGFWGLWIAAMQGVGLMGHFTPLMPMTVPIVYANAIALWSWPMLLVLGEATRLRHALLKTPSASPA